MSNGSSGGAAVARVRLTLDRHDESARASLRTALTQLRAALGPDAGRFVHATRERVTLAGPDEVWVDVGELERLLEEGQMQATLALYRDELLTGLEDDWVYARRNDLQQRLCEALGRAAMRLRPAATFRPRCCGPSPSRA